MAPHTHRRLLSASVSILFVSEFAVGCSGSGGDQAQAAQGWAGTGVNAVSRPVMGAGVAAVTGLRPDGSLETVAFDLDEGKRLWSRPTTMVGRPPGMGVQPPAVAGGPGAGLVASVEPRKTGRWNATLIARDARTGGEKWTRPVASTLGPVRCGTDVCMSEVGASGNPRFVALDAATGRPRWTTPGIAEVQHADSRRLVLFRMAKRPSLEARDPRTGAVRWTFPIERALGRGVDVNGGYAFGVAPGARSPQGDVLVGHMAPYQQRKSGPLSRYGVFGLRLSDGRPLWTRKQMVRVYPSANPAVALIARRFAGLDDVGGFERIDPYTGRTVATLPADRAPRTPWKLSLPSDLSKVGFLIEGKPSAAYEMRNGAKVTERSLRTWSFCTLNPPQLKITGRRGFYPVASLCAYEVATGRRATSPGAPPAWYTGVLDGRRVWRDEKGTLRGIRDSKGTAPGMYGM
jgi:PQQ-like domain